MELETRGALTALIAGLLVVGICYGLSMGLTPNLSKEAQIPSTDTIKTASISPAHLVTTGQSLYTQACAPCHGANGLGGFGPNLRGLGESNTQVEATIRDGIKGSMPAFGRRYSDAQQQTLVAYVKSLK